MQPIHRWTRRLLYFVLIISAIHLTLVFTGTTYIYQTALHLFPNIDDINLFPKREVKAGIPQPWKISKNYNKNKLSPALEKALIDYKSVAFLIVKDDSIVNENYWDNYSPASLSNSFSMAKTIVSILTGIALKEEKIKSLDQPIGEFLPDYTTAGRSKLTFRHLVTMSSGSSWDEAYANPFSVTTKAYYGDDIPGMMKDVLYDKEPGKKFIYQSGNTIVLGEALSKAVGTTLSNYAAEKLWKPIGAEHSAYWSIDRQDGEEKAYCCFYSNARDFARLGKLYLQKGWWNGRQIVDSAYAEESIKPAPLMGNNGKAQKAYGYAWWLIPDYKGHNIFYMRGIQGQYVIVIPDKKIIMVRLGNKRGEKVNDYYVSDVFTYIDEVLKMYPSSAIN